MGQYTGELVGETADNTTLGEGFLNAYNGAPLPAGVVLLNPTECTRGSDGLYSPVPGFEANGCDVMDKKASLWSANSPLFFSLRYWAVSSSARSYGLMSAQCRRVCGRQS